jgi:hypothetical protein
MKNIALIVIVILLIALLIVVRIIFTGKFEVFKTQVSQFELVQSEKFKQEKENKLFSLSFEKKIILQHFRDQFDENKCMTEKDTTFSFFYLHKIVKYRVPSIKYLECLKNKCFVDEKNLENQKLISHKEAELKKKYPEAFSAWYSKLKDDKILKKKSMTGDCNSYFPDVFEIYFDNNAWSDFEKFMLSYNSVISAAQIKNKQIENQFSSNVAKVRNQLRRAVLDYFDSKLSENKSQIIRTETVQKSFTSPTLGTITYYLYNTIFDQNALINISNDAFEEQWKSYSLGTGVMPYASCYGSINYCGSYNCSKISVKTGRSDVLVSIKDINRDVVRHAYINGGDSYTFYVSDGQYQVFFYSGKGWNPNKVMITTSCGKLHGGFVSGESITKDNYITLNNQIMTYELILQQNGNLSTYQSSMDEAFN